jgi:hypothetical protein
MAELTGFLAMAHGPKPMPKPEQCHVLHNRNGLK